MDRLFFDTLMKLGGNLELPTKYTQAQKDFAREHGRLVHHIIFTATHILRFVADEESPLDDDGNILYNKPSINKVALARESLFMGELLLSRAVDNYLTFLSDLLTIIFKHNPQQIKWKKEKTIEQIIKYPTMDEFISSFVDEYIDEISRSAQNLKTGFENIGITILPSKEETKQIQMIIELRNLIVHKRGKISDLFRKRFPKYNYSADNHVNVSFEKSLDYISVLMKSVVTVDAHAIEKYDLPYLRARLATK